MKILSALFLLASSVFVASGSYAQKVKWGPEIDERSRITITDIVSFNPASITVLKAKAPGGLSFAYKDYVLENYDKQLVPRTSAPIAPEFEGNELAIEFAFESAKKLFLFTSFTNRKLDKKFLFLQKINPKTLALEGPIKKVAELDFSKQYRTGGFGYSFSRDSSKIVLYCNSELRKAEPEKYSLVVFDANMEQLWTKSVTLPYTEDKFLVTDFAVDNTGNAFILGIKYQEAGLIGVSRRNGLPTYEYRILSYTEKSAEVNEYSVKYGDKFITDMRIDVSPEKDIICAGFYSLKGRNSVDGSYFLRIDRDSKAVTQSSGKEFGLDFITAEMRENQEERVQKREEKGKNQEMFEYDLRKLIPRADGGAILVAEQYFVRVVRYYNPSSKQYVTQYHYYYNDIIVVSIDPSGTIEWASKIPKRQHSVNDGGYFSSFATMVTDDQLYFIFNDDVRNLESHKQGVYHNFNLGDKNGIVTLAAVDVEGNIERRAFFSNQELETITRPKLCAQVSPTQMVLYAKKRGNSQLGLATF